MHLRSLLLALATLIATVPPAVAQQACSGRYRLLDTRRPLLSSAGTTADAPDAIILSELGMQIESGCPPTAMATRVTRKGLRLSARWNVCGTERKVRVRALLPRDCFVLRGTITTRKHRRPRRFSASHVRCGDGVLDDGEQCDDGNFESGDGCNACRLPRCGDGVVDPGEECDDGNGDAGDGCTPQCRGTCQGQQFASTWEAIQTVVFARAGCAQALCHSGGLPAGNLDLTPERAWTQLINVPATIDQGWLRVVPGDQARSLLWRKLAAATRGIDDVPGAPMPQAGAPIDANSLEAIRRWIRGGARETGVVPDTASLLDACLGPTTPSKIVPPPPPAPADGIQLYAPPWTIPPHGEGEVCFSTYYDVEDQIRAAAPGALLPCPAEFGGPGRSCFAYKTTDLTQDPNSHHSIINVYRGTASPTDSSWGRYTCHGGTHDGSPCNPVALGVPAPAGAECGERSACAGSVVSSVACIGYGPSDLGFGGGGFAGAQSPHARQEFYPGVYDVLPTRGVVVWNSHAFNLAGVSTTNEQWLNVLFATSLPERAHRVQPIFDISHIFDEFVPPFATQEICAFHVLPRGARLFQLSSHTHKRGKLFRIWDPEGALVLTTTEYSDPSVTSFDPPRAFDEADPARRTFKYCAIYDNGATDPREVKRRSQSPPPPAFVGSGGPCSTFELACLGGPKQGASCQGDDRVCAATDGGTDGVCDACPLSGGVTTEDEMFILLGSYYLP